MSDRKLSHLWTAAGITGLAWLWIGVLWAPGWSFGLGSAFLALPVVLGGVTLWARPQSDRVTILCAVALALLFLIAWLL
jgi:hypothetical protein